MTPAQPPLGHLQPLPDASPSPNGRTGAVNVRLRTQGRVPPSPGRPRRRKVRLPGRPSLLPLLVVLLPLLFFAPYLGGAAIPFGDDMLLLNYPLLSLLSGALHAGHPLVLWNPYSGGGYPLAPFSALVFYPLTWLLSVLPVSAAIGWTYALDCTIGGLGAYALAARLGVSPAARLVPAVSYPFSGFILAHLFAGHFFEVGLMCWFPLALAALHGALEPAAAGIEPLGTALRRGILCGGPLGMLVLANGVSWLVFVGYPLILVAIVLLARAARADRRKGSGTRALGGALLALAASGAVAGLLGAAVLLPLRDLIGQTVRGDAMGFHALTRTSEPPVELALSLAPGLFGSDVTHTYWFPNGDAYFQEVYAYLGLPVLVLAAVGLLAGRRRRNAPLYGAITLACVALALGANTPLYYPVAHLLPGLDLARVPARWLLPATLAVSVLAGVGADALIGAAARRAPPEGRARYQALALPLPAGGAQQAPPAPLVPIAPPTGLAILAVLGVLGLVAALAALGFHTAHAHAATVGPTLLRLLVVAALVAAALLVVPQAPRPIGAALLLALVLGDLWTANGPLLRPLVPGPYYHNAAVTLAEARAGTGRVWDTDPEHTVPLRQGMVDEQVQDVQDFASLTLADYWFLTHRTYGSLRGVDAGMARTSDLTDTAFSPRVADLLGVSTLIAPRPRHASSLVPLAQLAVPRCGALGGDWSHPQCRPGQAYAYAVPRHLSFAQPLYDVRVAAGRVDRAAVLDPGFDPHRTILLDGGATSAATGASVGGLTDLWSALLRSSIPRGTPGAVGPGVVRLGQTENGTILRATLRGAGMLLVDQVYDPGWKATVDGRAATVRRADDVLSAVAVPSGTHTIALVYAPPTYALGAVLTLLGYLLLLAAALWGRVTSG